MGIPLRSGSAFTDGDTASAPGVAIVNETLKRRFWPNEDAVGKRIRPDERWLVIRGVVADIKHGRLDRESDPEIYVPYEQLPSGLMKFVGRGMTVIVHGSLDDGSMARSLRAAVRESDPTLAIHDLASLDKMVANSIAQPRFRTGLLAAFSITALLLAALGIYGVMSHVVAQRSQEMGVRLALGAQPAAIARIVVVRALSITATGAAVGIAAAFALVRILRDLLFSVGEHDPIAFFAAPAIIVAVAVVASLVPARRAARVDPVLSLRAD